MGTLPARVLMTADAVGGVWTYALDLARGLSACGVRTTLAVLGPTPRVDQRAAAATVTGLGVIETGLSLDWTAESPEEVEAAGHRIADLANAIGVDLVHLNAPALAASAVFGRPVVGVCHSCVSTWWEAVRHGPLPPDLAWRADLVGRGYRRCDALLAPSKAFSAATARTYQLPAPPVVVPNGRGRAGFEGVTAPAEPFVFTAGRLWDEGKNVATLDRVAARLPVPVLAAGSTRAPDGSEIALHHALPLGLLTDEVIATHLARRPVFASLARYEPFGLAVLEAAQAGCALLLADIPTFRELWDGAAAFVSADDDEAVAREIGSLVGDDARRAALGEAARRRSERYSVSALVDGTLAIYRSLHGRRAAAA